MTFQPLPLMLFAAMALTACGDSATGKDSAAGEPVAATSALDGVPNFRPGLWEITDDTNGDMETRQECMEQGGDDMASRLAGSELPEGCTVVQTPRGGGMHMVATCKQDAGTMVQTLDISGSDTAYEIHMYMTTQATGQSPVEMGAINGKAKWLGPCPAAQ